MSSWVLYALLSAFFAALVAIFGKVGLGKIDTTLATTVRSLVMAGFLVLVSFFLGRLNQIGTLSRRAVLFIVLSGIAGALSWLFYFVALRKGPAPGVAALDRLSVVFVLILALLFLGDHLSWKNAAGAFLVTAGAVLMVMK